MEENNRQQTLLDLINQLEEDNCIVTSSQKSEFLPAVFRKGTKYQVYIHEFSPFENYDDVTDLIDEIIRYVSDENFIEYKIISHDEFYQMRLEFIKNDIKIRLENINTPENETFKKIKEEVERDISTYIISNGTVKFLIGAVSTDDDWYYLCLVQDRGAIQIEFDTCVSPYVPLHRYLPVEEYRKVTEYVIEEAISEKNIDTTTQWICEKINETTEFVPFTMISLKDGTQIGLKPI